MLPMLEKLKQNYTNLTNLKYVSLYYSKTIHFKESTKLERFYSSENQNKMKLILEIKS